MFIFITNLEPVKVVGISIIHAFKLYLSKLKLLFLVVGPPLKANNCEGLYPQEMLVFCAVEGCSHSKRKSLRQTYSLMIFIFLLMMLLLMVFLPFQLTGFSPLQLGSCVYPLNLTSSSRIT